MTEILLIGPLGTKVDEILIGIQNIFFNENALATWRLFCLDLNVLTEYKLNLSWKS